MEGQDGGWRGSGETQLSHVDVIVCGANQQYTDTRNNLCDDDSVSNFKLEVVSIRSPSSVEVRRGLCCAKCEYTIDKRESSRCRWASSP